MLFLWVGMFWENLCISDAFKWTEELKCHVVIRPEDFLLISHFFSLSGNLKSSSAKNKQILAHRGGLGLTSKYLELK